MRYPTKTEKVLLDGRWCAGQPGLLSPERSKFMNLIKISGNVAVNPDRVIAVKSEPKMYWGKNESGKELWKPLETGERETFVYTQELDGEYSDTASLMYTTKEKSDYTFKETIKLLTEFQGIKL